MSEKSAAEQVRRIAEYVEVVKGEPDHFALICVQVAEEAERMSVAIQEYEPELSVAFTRIAQGQLRLIRKEFDGILPEELKE